jgi:hypothetical protein
MKVTRFATCSSQFAPGNFISPIVRFPVCWFALLLLSAGCHRGPVLAPVKGVVTMDGKPMSLATVRFEPEFGRASLGHTNDNGQYELRYTRDDMGALVGHHTVRILSATEVSLPNGQFVIRPQIVPPRFNIQSELQREVIAGQTNEFNFDLQSAK